MAILMRMRGLGRVPVVTLMLMLGLVGCGPARDTDRDPGPSPGRSTEQDAPPRGSLGEAAERVDFDLPRGFVESQAYHVVTPLYPDPRSRWLVPDGTDGGLDVIGVHWYRTSLDFDRDTPDELIARLDGYAVQVRAESASTPVASTVAGQPALTQTIRQPGDAGRSYVYESTFVFAGSHLVQVMCQVDRKATAVVSGCATVRATLRLSLG
jgi:hypothetical protein